MLELLILATVVLTMAAITLALVIFEVERRRSDKRLEDYYRSMAQFRQKVPFEGIDKHINPKREDA